jgi:hypothetical protein
MCVIHILNLTETYGTLCLSDKCRESLPADSDLLDVAELRLASNNVSIRFHASATRKKKFPAPSLNSASINLT